MSRWRLERRVGVGMLMMLGALAAPVGVSAASAQPIEARPAARGVASQSVDADRVELWPGARAIFVRLGDDAQEGVGGLVLGTVTVDGTPVEARVVRVFLRRGPDGVGGEGAAGARWGRWWSRAGAGGVGVPVWGVREVLDAGVRAGVSGQGGALGDAARRGQSGESLFLRVDVSGVVNDPTRLGESRLRLGERVVTLRRVDAELIAQGRALVNQVVRSRLAPGVDASAALNVCGALANLPMDRWRARAVLSVLNAPTPAIEVAEGSDASAETVLGELAEQVGVRWLAAIGRLDRADRAIAQAMTEQLFRIVRTETHAIPAWNAQEPSEYWLCAELLDPERGRDGLIRVAQEFVASQRASVMWVIDDAASATPGGTRSRGRIGFANLGTAPALARVRLATGEDVVEPVAGLSGVEVLTPLMRAGGGEAGAVASVTVRVGIESATMAVVTGAAGVRPPGLDVGPLLLDWTSESWLAGRLEFPGGEGASSGAMEGDLGAALPEAWRTTARVYFAEPGEGAARGGGPNDSGEWLVYVDCRQGAGAVRVEDQVTLRFGTRGETSATISVGADGRAVDDRGRLVQGVRVVTKDGSAGRPAAWSAWVPIPASVQAGRLVRVGMQRVDARGVRSAWPRPMMPWQIEPGRVALDLGQWLGLPE